MDHVEEFIPVSPSYTDAPILLLFLFRKALRAELVEIHGVLSVALDSECYNRELVVEVRSLFEFLKLAYKYYCAYEDEVIFFALDAHTNYVAHTYSLEHRSLDDLFDSIFHSLNVLLEANEYLYRPLQELISCIDTLQSAVCKHMTKEEKHVFPLLLQQFSSLEQASLVWRFMCSIPIMLLMDVFPWMISFLSANEQVDVQQCMKEVIPKEQLLQEVVFSWITDKNRPSLGRSTENGFSNLKDFPKEYYTRSLNGVWRQSYFLQTNVTHSPVDGVPIWHGAIKTDFKEILEELYLIRSSNNYVNLASVIVHLKFLADVLTFHSNALDEIIHHVLKEAGNSRFAVSSGRFFSESQIEGLQRSLYYNSENGVPLRKYVEKLCREVESFLKRITELFSFQETEVFPLISNNCDHVMQQQLLYMSLHSMPLGLLKCTIAWFAARLSEDQSIYLFGSMNNECPLVSTSFAYLLLEWVRVVYSGKTSVKKFRNDLQNMFETKCFLLTDQIKKDTGSSSVHVDDTQPCHKSIIGKMEAIPFQNAKNYELNSPYSSGINMHIFFPGTLEILCPFPKIPLEEANYNSNLQLEPRPLDHILFFHNALKKDLEYLVFGSTQLADNVGHLVDFRERFNLVQYLYQIHSDAEDQIAYPALEAKGEKGQNISNSYMIDHKAEADHFSNISLILDEMTVVHASLSSARADDLNNKLLEYRQLCTTLHDKCKTMHKILSDHIHREEIEVWPLFRECLSIQEQENVIGFMLGRRGAEILQKMIPWLMAYLTPTEQQSMMSLWRKATKNTMFDEWLREWWGNMRKYDISSTTEDLNILPSLTDDPLELLGAYLSKEGSEKSADYSLNNCVGADIKQCRNYNDHDKEMVPEGDERAYQCFECSDLVSEDAKKKSEFVTGQKHLQVSQKLMHREQLLSMSQEDLEATIRRVSRDSSLDAEKKSYLLQNLLMSRWTVTQQKSSEATNLNGEEFPGRCPSYRNPVKEIFGCKHYKRNCKILAACCNQLYACRNCHDEVAGHSMDRKATTKMMCMKCLAIQPIGPTCSTASCDNFSLARYYCKICKLFDDEREIYHCPYCNLCRVGKGLGIDYFHCMTCNACMSRSLSVHVCREKSFEDKCPICHEDIFTSTSPVKALRCGHMMHSSCFQDYTCTNYTCPICSKSLGDMKKYFGMLDAMLAKEKIPDEYSGSTQVIFCNDCEKRGEAPYHWLHHKCTYCGSYNTRIAEAKKPDTRSRKAMTSSGIIGSLLAVFGEAKQRCLIWLNLPQWWRLGKKSFLKVFKRFNCFTEVLISA